MGRAKKNVEVEAQVIARGNVVPMMTETESEETVQYVSDEDAAREDTGREPPRMSRAYLRSTFHLPPANAEVAPPR